MSEIEVQKKLTYVGIAALASTPFIGPLGIIGASAIFSGKFLRLSLNSEAKKNYRLEKEIIKKSERDSSFYSNFINESPETAIARQIPNPIAKLLNKNNKRKNYNEGLRQGSEIIEKCLQKLPEEEYSKIKKIQIYPEQQIKILGIPFGRKSLVTKIIK